MKIFNKLIVLTIFTVIFINGCSTKSENLSIKETSQSLEQNELYNKLRNLDVSNENHFIYNADSFEKKNITLTFTFAIENLDIDHISLYADKDQVMKDVTIINKEENKLVIQLNEFIPYFNNVYIILKNGTDLKLDVGEYYLEKFSMDDFSNYKSDLMTIEQYHDSFEKGKYTMYAVITKNDKSKINYILPKKTMPYIRNLRFTQKDLNDETVKYSLSFEMDKGIVSDRKLDEVYSEVALVQSFMDKRWTLVKSSISIRKTDFIELNS